MPKYRGECRVCGKNYSFLCTSLQSGNRFNWQKVACSPECGEEYFRRIAESRKPTQATEPVEAKKAEKAEKTGRSKVAKHEIMSAEYAVSGPQAESKTIFEM